MSGFKIGVDDGGREVSYFPRLHNLMCGASRSGKTVASMVALTQCVGRLQGQLLVCGWDPTGMLLQPFRSPWVVTGIDDAALDNVIDVLRNVVALMHSRNADLVEQRRMKLEHFDSDTPLVMVVLEEFQLGSMVMQGQRRKEFDSLVAQVATNGLKCGVALLILVQEASKALLGVTRPQMGGVYAMRLAKREELAMVLPDSPEPEMVKRLAESQPGQGYAVTQDHRGPRFFRSMVIGESVYYDTVERLYRVPAGVL